MHLEPGSEVADEDPGGVSGEQLDTLLDCQTSLRLRGALHKAKRIGHPRASRARTTHLLTPENTGNQLLERFSGV